MYTLPLAPGMAAVPVGVQRPVNLPNVRTKEEKEVLEHFAGVVCYFHFVLFIFIYLSPFHYVRKFFGFSFL